MPDLEVWFQRATDVVRKLLYGDVDIGIVGYDMFREIADKDPELVVVHDALGFGSCHLGLGVPTTGKFANINTLDQLRRCSYSLAVPRIPAALVPTQVRLEQTAGPVCCSMPDWTETRPLRVVTGYHNVARRYFEESGFEHVVLLSADGALEAAPLMGSADIILDLVSMMAPTLAVHMAAHGCRGVTAKFVSGRSCDRPSCAGEHGGDPAGEQSEGD